MPLPFSRPAVIRLRRCRGGPMWPPAPPWAVTSVGRAASQGFALRGDLLCPRRQRRQNAAGGGLRWASPPIVAPPPVPRLRGIPLRPSAKVPARKIRFRVSFLPGHWALIQCKISVDMVPQPRLFPTSRGRGCEIGGAPDEAVPMERGRAATEGRPYGVTGKTSCNRGRAATEGHPPFVDHDARRARRPGAPPQRAKPSTFTEEFRNPAGGASPSPTG